MKVNGQLKTKSAFAAGVWLFVWAFIVTMMSLFLTAYSHADTGKVFVSYFMFPSVIVLNFVPVLLAAAFFFCLTNRVWTATLFSSFVVFSASWINYFKMLFRSEPFMAADMAFVNEAFTMTGRYKLVPDLCFWLSFALVAVGTAASFLFDWRSKKYNINFFCALGFVFVLVLSVRVVYLDDGIYERTDTSAVTGEFLDSINTADALAERGFVYSFIHSFGDVFDSPPECYSKDRATAALEKFSDSNIPDDRKFNVISIMLESFNDFSKFDSLKFRSNPYAAYKRLKKRSVFGNIFVSTFGGGTVNTERAFLTGYSKPFEYRAPTDTHVRYFKNQGYTVEGAHPGNSWFYTRDVFNRNIGFDNYYFFEDRYGSIFEATEDRSGHAGDKILEDRYFFDDIMNLYEANLKSGKPYFGFFVSYQNHGPYNPGWLEGGEYVRRGDASLEAYNIINNYLAGIKDTSDELEKLADRIDKREEPILLVAFGDHNPWLGNDGSVYAEYGINLDFDTDDGLYNYFEVPYIIFANSAARKIVGDVSGDGGDFGMMYLMNKVFDVAGWEGSGFMKLSNELEEKLDIVTNIGICREDGELKANIRGESKTLRDDFLAAQYLRKHTKIKK